MAIHKIIQGKLYIFKEKKVVVVGRLKTDTGKVAIPYIDLETQETLISGDLNFLNNAYEVDLDKSNFEIITLQPLNSEENADGNTEQNTN